MLLLIVFSFIAGIVTVLSPCILPILPIILSSTIGENTVSRSRPLGVVVGFIFSFTFFTLFLSTLVRLSGISADALRQFSVIVIAVFGVSLLVPQFQQLVEKLFSNMANLLPVNKNRSGFFGGIVIGLSIGLLWTPCVGPILASVISLAISETVTASALFITLAYSLGTAIPMFFVMIAGQSAFKKVPWLFSRLSAIQKLFGILMILTSIGILFNIDRRFQNYILDTFPQYGVGLTKIEDSELIRDEINNLLPRN